MSDTLNGISKGSVLDDIDELVSEIGFIRSYLTVVETGAGGVKFIAGAVNSELDQALYNAQRALNEAMYIIKEKI